MHAAQFKGTFLTLSPPLPRHEADHMVLDPNILICLQDMVPFNLTVL
jgi:hypothetical protein